MTSYNNFGDDIWRMENDLSTDGQLLLLDGNGIKTAYSGETHLIWNLDTAFTFTQINKEILAAPVSNCIKKFNRKTETATNLINNCPVSTEKPGPVRYIRYMLMDVKRNALLFNEGGENKIKMVNINDGNITTLIENGVTFPWGMAWCGDIVLVVGEQSLSQVMWGSDGKAVVERLIGESKRDTIGPFTEAKFNKPSLISLLFPNIYLVIDADGKRLRLIDMIQQRVSRVSLNPTNSEIPQSILMTKDALLFANDNKMTKSTS